LATARFGERAARMSAPRIAVRGISRSKRTESLCRFASARDSPECQPPRHSGNSLMQVTPRKGNRTFFPRLPRDIIHYSKRIA
jgi:hypothetical protein